MEKLIKLFKPESREQKDLATYLKDWFKENGTIAIEHGYKAWISYNKEIWNLYSVNERGIYLFNREEKKGRRVQWEQLNKQALLDVINICNDYYNFCLTEA